MKKKLALIILSVITAICCAFGLSACSSDWLDNIFGGTGDTEQGDTGDTEQGDTGDEEQGSSGGNEQGGDTGENTGDNEQGGNTGENTGDNEQGGTSGNEEQGSSGGNTGDTEQGGTSGDEENPTHTHVYDQKVATETYLISKATCTAKAVYYYSCSCGETGTATFEYGKLAAHTEVSANNGTAATCTTAGKENDTICSVCQKTLSEGAVIPATGHTWNDGVTTQAASCTAVGETTYTCTVCKATKTETVAALGHNYVSGVCSRCGAKESSTDQLYTRVDENGNESSTGKYILFGSYPQSQVTDSATLANLTWEDAQTTALPTPTNANGWTDYGYYILESVTSYMWYKDVTYSGDEYRAVYFIGYRPYYTTNPSSAGYSYQYTNGYYTSTVYWFKYEPIKWRILEESNGMAFLMADIILDSQQYYHTTRLSTRTAVENYNDAYYAGNGSTVNGMVNFHNYLYSDIRAWLNETFYKTAFTEYEKQLVQTTLVDNSSASTTDTGGNLTQSAGYACANTNDKVFLLSEYEVTNSSYGFASYNTYDTERQLKSTAYAKSQGCWAETDSSYLGNGWWWLRSPYDSSNEYARIVYYDGNANLNSHVISTCGCVVPALHIQL